MSTAAASSERTSFELEVNIDAPVSRVRAYLVDLHKMASLHPLIESIEDVPAAADDAPDDAPTARRYRVVDRVPIWFFHVKTVYEASIEPVGDTEVRAFALTSSGVRVSTIRSLEAVSEDATRVVERCHVDAGWLFQGFAVAQARKAHAKSLDDLKALLESS